MRGLQRGTPPLVPRVVKHSVRTGHAVLVAHLNRRPALVEHVFDGPPAAATILFEDGTRGGYLLSDLVPA